MSKFLINPSCGYAHAPVAGVTRGRDSCSAGTMPTWDAGGGGIDGADSSGAHGGASCCMHRGAATAEPARPITITVCAGRKGGGSGGDTGLSGERQEKALAEWRSQGSELAEWRSQVRELAESAAGCRTVKSGCRTMKSGCRTVPAQAVHISTYWELWVSPERGCSSVEVRLCIASLASVRQCSLFLCFSRRLLQRTSHGAGLAVGQWVVERWPTMHRNRAPKMGAARNWVFYILISDTRLTHLNEKDFWIDFWACVQGVKVSNFACTGRKLFCNAVILVRHNATTRHACLLQTMEIAPVASAKPAKPI